MPKTALSPIGVLRGYFGQHAGQTVTAFAAEAKALKAACDAKSPTEYNDFIEAVAKEHGCSVKWA